MTQKARIGIVGLGPMGRDLMNAAMNNPRAEVVAVCDSSPAVLNEGTEAAPVTVATYGDYRTMLDAGGLDGVVVATPQYLHAEMSIQAMKAGFHVFCEKPMAMDMGQCEAMLAASRTTGRRLMIGQVLRYIGPYRFVLEEARSGKYGKPFAMRVIRTAGHWTEPWIRPWRLTYAESGGLLPEVNVHEIDLMLQVLQDTPVAVYAAGANYAYPEVDYEDFVTATVVFKNGATGSLTSVCSDFVGRNTGEIYCEKGTLYYDSICNEVRVGEPGQEKRAIPYSEVLPDAENGVAREIREFVEMCLGEHGPTIPGEQGMLALEVCQAVYLSARERREVHLPLPRG